MGIATRNIWLRGHVIDIDYLSYRRVTIRTRK